MAAIQIVSSDSKQLRRTQTVFDQRVSFSQGLSLLINASSSTTIADVITATGTITLPSKYPVGRNALRVYIDGNLLPQVGVDYTEDSTTELTLDAGHVATLDAATSAIFIEWQRFKPGVRDQDLSDLANVTPDLQDAFLDSGALRAAAANSANPLATFQDLGLNLKYIEGSSLSGSTALSNSQSGSVGDTTATLTFASLSSTNPDFDDTRIAGVFLTCFTGIKEGDGGIDAEFPDGTLHNICTCGPGSVGADGRGTGLTAFVPVIPGQTSIDIRYFLSGGITPGDITQYSVAGLLQV